MTRRSYRNTDERGRLSNTKPGSRTRPDLFAAPKHFERHGKPLTAAKLTKAAARYGVRIGKSNLRRGERRAS